MCAGYGISCSDRQGFEEGELRMAITVNLIASTPEAARTVAAAAKLCYSASGASDILDGLTAEKTVLFLKMLREAGHLSPFEHVSFTFAAEGLSRVCTHQLVRHRLASYSQQSQRYVGMDKAACVVPPSVAAVPEALRLYEAQLESAWKCYRELAALGVDREDARFVLPHGAETKIVVTMNARELHHFFGIRLCRRAQWEIRELARLMLLAVREAAPEIFDIAGPSCVVSGKCNEAHPCGTPYRDIGELLSI